MMILTRFSACMGGVVIVLFTLAGCDYNKDKVAHVKMVTVAHTVIFDGSKKQLSKTEFEALDAFIQSVPVSAVSYVGLEADDSNPRAVERAKQIKTYLVKQGVNHEAIHLQPVTTGDDTTIMLNIQYAVAVPPGPCPDWSKRSTGTYNTTTGSDFGCAYYNDFIVQLANPADFEGGQGQVPVIDPDRDSALVQKYRSASGGGSSSGAGASSGSSAR